MWSCFSKGFGQALHAVEYNDEMTACLKITVLLFCKVIKIPKRKLIITKKLVLLRATYLEFRR